MLKNINTQHDWKESFYALMHKQVVYMLMLGFSAGLPLFLIFSSLSLWLREAGIEKSAVTYFSWAALGYSFKFVWAPLVDRLPIPVLTKALGLRRSWLLVSQIFIFMAISFMALTDPSVDEQLVYMALSAVLLGFSSATQDISIDAYRIEAVDADMQAMASAAYMAGYRLGMMLSSAGVLYLATYYGSTAQAYSYEAWSTTYHIVSFFMLVGVLATFLISEPIKRDKEFSHANTEYFGLFVAFIISICVFLAAFNLTSEISSSAKSVLADYIYSKQLSGFFVEVLRLLCAGFITFWLAKSLSKTHLVSNNLIESSYVAPIKTFFNDYGKETAILLLLLIGLYRISDIVLGVIANVFYYDMGFTKIEVADATKLFGLAATIFGGFVGGILAMRFGVMRMLFISALLVVVTNLLFILLFYTGNNLTVLYGVVAMDNLVAGVSTAAFIAFLSSLVNIQFTAIQYAIFSSLMTLVPKVLAGYSGAIVDSLGYVSFFVFSSCLGIPVMFLVYSAGKALAVEQKTEA